MYCASIELTGHTDVLLKCWPIDYRYLLVLFCHQNGTVLRLIIKKLTVVGLQWISEFVPCGTVCGFIPLTFKYLTKLLVKINTSNHMLSWKISLKCFMSFVQFRLLHKHLWLLVTIIKKKALALAFSKSWWDWVQSSSFYTWELCNRPLFFTQYLL